MLQANASHYGGAHERRTLVESARDDCCHHAAPAADASFRCLRKGALSPKSVAASAERCWRRSVRYGTSVSSNTNSPRRWMPGSTPTGPAHQTWKLDYRITPSLTGTRGASASDRLSQLHVYQHQTTAPSAWNTKSESTECP